jgi:hypothetical protein
MTDLVTKPLDAWTWEAFADLAERDHGVWGGCWSTWFHPAPPEEGTSPRRNRASKERLVREGRAHAALVFDGDVAVAWCQYGSPAWLPGSSHLKEYTAGVMHEPAVRDRPKGKATASWAGR